jgi:GT2 family glycosyltransferase
MDAGKSPKLSIVVTSYTTERINDTFELLDSIKKQTYPDVETIFVAERSKELLQRIKAYTEENSIANVKVVFNDGEPGLSVARNLGIKHSIGDIVGFTDDDALLFPDWAEQVVKALENDHAIGVTGSASPLWEDESLKWLPEEFYWLVSCIAWTGWTETRVVRGAFGANMAFKREAFADGCLFSPNAGYARASQHQPVSDDLEFSLRVRKKVGKSIVFSPGPQVWHRVYKKRLGWKFVMARSHQIGCTRRIIKKYYIEEMGSFEQEQHVLKGVFGLLWRIPKELFTRPSFACKKFYLIFIVLSSVAVGYLVPIPTYSHIKQKVV